jgi:SpoVK/Ycf46/Vps4 family AAA+-type ATPase
MDWNDLAGYDNIAQEIRTTVIDATKHADMFDEIMKLTRVRPESNKPKAVLFEGNPGKYLTIRHEHFLSKFALGTGKTSGAKIIASQSSLPMIFVPLQSIMSMYYGESEKTLAKIFDAVDRLGDAVIFMDEIDSIAPSREGDIHEASRRILSVLLQRIDGLESSKTNSLIIAATNRKQDLDPALLSRFDVVIRFNDPDVNQRAKIFARYAKHLSEQDRYQLALKSEKLTGRDIRDVCAHAERTWGSKLIQGNSSNSALTNITATAPPREVYEESLSSRLTGLRF